MTVRTYSPREVTVLVGGVPLTGFGDGTFVSVELPDATTSQKGAAGAHTRTLSADRSAMVKITLQQTSPANAVLSSMWASDQAAGAGVRPLIIKNLRGTELFFAPQAWVQKAPNIEFGAESGNREWSLECGDCKVTL